MHTSSTDGLQSWGPAKACDKDRLAADMRKSFALTGSGVPTSSSVSSFPRDLMDVDLGWLKVSDWTCVLRRITHHETVDMRNRIAGTSSDKNPRER